MQKIGAAWASVREAVPDHVTVVAVSKTKPVEAVVTAHAAGARVFGENRVQELVGKHEALTHPDAPSHGAYPDLHWHQIGTGSTSIDDGLALDWRWIDNGLTPEHCEAAWH